MYRNCLYRETLTTAPIYMLIPFNCYMIYTYMQIFCYIMNSAFIMRISFNGYIINFSYAYFTVITIIAAFSSFYMWPLTLFFIYITFINRYIEKNTNPVISVAFDGVQGNEIPSWRTLTQSYPFRLIVLRWRNALLKNTNSWKIHGKRLYMSTEDWAKTKFVV